MRAHDPKGDTFGKQLCGQVWVLILAAFAVEGVLLAIFSKLQGFGESLALEGVYYTGIIVVPCLFTVWAWVWSRRIETTLCEPDKESRGRYLELCWGVPAFAICGAFLYILRGLLLRHGLLSPYKYPVEYAFAIVVICPIYEEVMFRRLLFRSLLSSNRAWKAIALSSLVFALFHFGSYPVPFVEFCGGVFFCGFYLWRKTLIAPIAAHMGANLALALMESLILT